MHVCPVCGYPKLDQPPRSPSGGGSYEICPSCGFQFGVDDDDRGHTYEQARKVWVTSGMKWSGRGIRPPKAWNARDQLASLEPVKNPARKRIAVPAAKPLRSAKKKPKGRR